MQGDYTAYGDFINGSEPSFPVKLPYLTFPDPNDSLPPPSTPLLSSSMTSNWCFTSCGTARAFLLPPGSSTLSLPGSLTPRLAIQI